MGCKTANLALSSTLLLILVGLGSSNLDQDRAECADQLVGLATCLPYVEGDAKAPTLDCCTGLGQVLQKSMKCLCVLIRDRDDPNLGLKINVTLALHLPTACHAPNKVSECVFKANSTSNGSGTAAEEKSDGGGVGKRWPGAEIVCGILIWLFTPYPAYYV
ncbi:Protein YLS3 [Morella rubra]|uniref:Protein YLS3 n=1 Tax=Morella rubra TaxID=262757 RepID=A0A6A1W703_9ROSI|nr:Protein YLS3 [Morella rubra]